MRKLYAGLLGAIALTTVLTGSAQAAGASAAPAKPSPPVSSTVLRDAALPCAPGGPYHEGNDAVWHNCDDSVDRIKVRQYFPYDNYEVCVPPHGEHRNSWTWTIDMHLIHDGHC
ncbi:hypothetical protein [Actinomadura rubrisoli]|uniref:Secreted protein n=1 Tax=Actinomadura rubrisoli TaxID=2530368 RepID=A0A4V2YYS0_9ACTN|nr:hypothetical protein [Actinomadura rubrisoli]TDD94257.1 hypothetical protein E1298_07380 [Actinomadura rubrisoli]